MQLQPGEIILNGKYRIERLLGRGGYGEVYLATHSQLRSQRAIKVMRRDAPDVGSTNFRHYTDRFRLEAELGAQVNDLGLTQVVRVYDVESFADEIYLVMEYLPGRSVKDLLAEGGALPWERAVAILLDAARGLAELYDRLGVVHRDVKPSNILLDAAGRAKIADLGLVQTRHDLSRRSLDGSQGQPHPGTPGYRSPEHENPNPLSPTADVYGLGCVAFEMLTGQPWYAVSPRADRVRDLAPETPPWLDDLVARMLCEEPGLRAADAGNPAKRFVDLKPVIAELEQGVRTEAQRTRLAAQQQQGQAAAEREREIAAAARRRALPWMLGSVALLAVLLAVWRPWAGGAGPAPTPAPAALLAAQPATLAPTETPRPAPTITSAPRATPSRSITVSDTLTMTPSPDSTATAKSLTAAEYEALKQTAIAAGARTATPTLGIGSTWTSPIDGMVQVYVPAGQFLMGEPQDGPYYQSSHTTPGPLRYVFLEAYWIDQTETTNAMFSLFVEATGYRTDAEKAGISPVYNTDTKSWKDTAGADWQHPRGPASSISDRQQHPVVLVSWDDADVYCRWAGRRLPTEEEWEKAARGVDGKVYPWGDEWDVASTRRLNFSGQNLDGSWVDSSADDGYQFTAPVGSYPAGASPYGALDMAGNVWEWTWTPDAHLGNLLGIMRGGAWSEAQWAARAGNRDNIAINPGGWMDTIGFRCARPNTGDVLSVEAASPVRTATLTDTPRPTATPRPTDTPRPTITPTRLRPTATPTLGIGSTWTSPVDGMVQVYVPAGEFTMGSADSDIDVYSHEKPQHRVTLDAYWIDRTEVTNAMFAQFVATTGCQTDAEKEGSSLVYDATVKGWQPVSGADWQHPRGPGSDLAGLDAHPVVLVTWNDAAAYCAWAGRRLPTEAEWEKAARGTDGRMYPWGNGNVTGDLLNFADRNLDVDWSDRNVNDGYRFMAPVGSYPKGASPYGVLNMAGNVWEWVADWYDEKYYANSPVANPKGPDAGQNRVLRGGSWDSDSRYVRAAYRVGYHPNFRVDGYGFRCARSQ